MSANNAYLDAVQSPELSATREHMRVAWLFPLLARPHYWQPVFREFTRMIPNTTIFTGKWGGFAAGYEGTINLRVIEGGKAVVLKNHQEGYHPGFFWAPLSIFRELGTFKPDIIFTSGFSMWTVCALLYKLFKSTTVIVLWDGCSEQAAYKISKARSLFRRLIGPFIDYAVSNMREGVEYMRDALHMPGKKLLAHPYQVADLAMLDSSSSDLNFPTGTRPVFLFVGKINARKGWRYLLDAARCLVDQGMNEFSLVFVGAGEQEEELHARIKELNLSSIVCHVGPLPYYKMATCYRNTDVFVFPTTEDVWGVVLVEAMAFGKAVICSKYAGTREMVGHEENGFVCDPRDVDSLAGYMAQFIRNPNLISEFGVRSRERIAPYTSTRAGQVLAQAALQAHQSRQSA
jgi:glycosyltransferase involved in cell wall biosynthesis